MRLLKAITLFVFLYSLSSFAENTDTESSVSFFKSCQHTLEILESKSPRPIDYVALGCLKPLHKYSQAVYRANQDGIILDICIDEEHAFPTLSNRLGIALVKAALEYGRKYPDAINWSNDIFITAAYIDAFPCDI